MKYEAKEKLDSMLIDSKITSQEYQEKLSCLLKAEREELFWKMRFFALLFFLGVLSFIIMGGDGKIEEMRMNIFTFLILGIGGAGFYFETETQ